MNENITNGSNLFILNTGLYAHKKKVEVIGDWVVFDKKIKRHHHKEPGDVNMLWE